MGTSEDLNAVNQVLPGRPYAGFHLKRLPTQEVYVARQGLIQSTLGYGSLEGIEDKRSFVRDVADMVKSYFPNQDNNIDRALVLFSQEHVSPAYLALVN